MAEGTELLTRRPKGSQVRILCPPLFDLSGWSGQDGVRRFNMYERIYL